MPKPKTSYGKSMAPMRQKLGLAAKGKIPNVSTIYKNSNLSKSQIKSAIKDTKATGAAKELGVHSFPGQIKGSSSGIKTGTPGLFTQSVKGMEGKKYIQKALDRVLKMYASDMEE